MDAQPPAQPAPAFLDVAALLESSQPRVRVGLFWYALGGFLLVVLGATVLSQGSDTGRRLVDALSAVAMVALIAGMAVVTAVVVRRHRAAQQAIEAAAEMVQLRRWPQAAALLQDLLSRPGRSASLRAQAL